MVTILNIGERNELVFLDRLECYVKKRCKIVMKKEMLDDL